MKISYVSFSSLTSETANSIQVCKMSEALYRQGHEVTLYAKLGNSLSPYDYYDISKNVRIERIKIPKIKFNWIFYSVVVIWKILKNKSELIYARDSFSALLLALLGYKVIFESHSIAFGRDRFIYKLLFKNKNVSLIVAISEALKKRLLTKYKLSSNKILVSHDGVNPLEDIHIFEKVKTKNKFLVGYCGSLFKGRGIELIIEIANKLKMIDFLVIGGRKKQVEIFKEKINIKNIFFKGHIQNSKVPNYLIQCDVLLMPYQKKLKTANNGPSTTAWMSPLKLFEYLEYGKPIISSDFEVLKEVITHKLNALLLPPDDLKKWIKSIELLKKDENLRNYLSKNSKELAKKYYWQERAKKIINHFIKLKK